ncbi:MAG: SDR family NAD(P)-dependent oxidoreductase [Chloroflexota bacterium]
MENKQTILITGGNSGLGYECAKTLAKEKRGHLVIASRNKKRVEQAVERLKLETGYDSIDGMALDLGSFESVRGFATALKSKGWPPLSSIVCNAGLSPAKNSKTVDGIDLIFGVNHLGHYLLVHLLTEQLVDSARVIFVSSGTHLPEHKLARRMGVPVPKYHTAVSLAYPEQAPSDERIESPPQRYSTSKLCNVLATYEFDRQFKKQGMTVSVFALDPGLMPGTGLARDFPKVVRTIAFGIIGFLGRWVDGIRRVEDSGQHLARLVTDEGLNGRSALYFDGLQQVRSSADSYNIQKAADLWETSARLVALKPEESRLWSEPGANQAA